MSADEVERLGEHGRVAVLDFFLQEFEPLRMESLHMGIFIGMTTEETERVRL